MVVSARSGSAVMSARLHGDVPVIEVDRGDIANDLPVFATVHAAEAALERSAALAQSADTAGAFRAAARALFQERAGGANRIDDRRALAEARALIQRGEARSVRDACALVSRAMSCATAESVKRDTERLRKKIKSG